MMKCLLLLFISSITFQITIIQAAVIKFNDAAVTFETLIASEEKKINSRTEDNSKPDTTNPTQILPLNFLSVNSRIINTYSFVHWVVSEDNEVDHYELEESHNGSVFHLLKNMPAQRNNFRTEYTAEDENLNIGNNFYRVKAIGISGKTIYSKIIKISYGKIDNTLFVYPNPANAVLKVQLHGVLTGSFKLHIYNDAAQEIYNQVIYHDGIDKTFTVQLPANLPSGMYRLFFIDKYKFYKQNFLVQ